jgi:hypothetical protein
MAIKFGRKDQAAIHGDTINWPGNNIFVGKPKGKVPLGRLMGITLKLF